MGSGDIGPNLPGIRYEDWDVADPDGLDLTDVRQIRDDIASRVHALLAHLTCLGQRLIKALGAPPHLLSRSAPDRDR